MNRSDFVWMAWFLFWFAVLAAVAALIECMDRRRAARSRSASPRIVFPESHVTLPKSYSSQLRLGEVVYWDAQERVVKPRGELDLAARTHEGSLRYTRVGYVLCAAPDGHCGAVVSVGDRPGGSG